MFLKGACGFIGNGGTHCYKTVSSGAERAEQGEMVPGDPDYKKVSFNLTGPTALPLPPSQMFLFDQIIFLFCHDVPGSLFFFYLFGLVYCDFKCFIHYDECFLCMGGMML